MPTDVTRTLKQALSRLLADRQRIDRQTTAIQGALQALNGASDGARLSSAKKMAPSRKRRRRQMSLADRKAVGRRMKAYWVKRRAAMSRRKKAAS